MTLALDALFAVGARPRKRERPLRGVQPNVGIEAWYRVALHKLIDEMQRSVAYFVRSAFRKEEPAVAVLAQDDMASRVLEAAIGKLRKQWLKRFDAASRKLAKFFALKVSARTDSALRKILKDSGFSVDFRMTKAQRDVLSATTHENVGLIRSIPQQYLGQVQGAVMRSVATGRDLRQLNRDLLKIGGVTKRRAKFIALDQSNKATANLTRVRQLEVAGADAEAQWVHSSAGKEPRPTHAKAGRDKVRYKVADGWYDPAEGRHVFPGELPNCRCIAKLVIKGFS